MPAINLKAVQSLQTQLKDHEAYLIQDPIDLYYLLTSTLSLGHFLIEKTRITLFVDGRYFGALSKLQELNVMASENQGLQNYLKTTDVKLIYFDSDKTSVSQKEILCKNSIIDFQGQRDILKNLRLIKSDDEIKKIRTAAYLLKDIYQEFLKRPKLGLSEKQIARDFKILSLEMGAEDFSFEPIIAIGENGAYPHHRPGDRILKEGDSMLVDIGVSLNHYQSDMTRMVFFGHVPQKLLEMHDQVLKAHQAALSLCKPGVKVGALDEAAREVFKSYGTESLFCHSLGHGLGLETHESPRLKFDGMDKDILLEKGMVITIEPGLYEVGLGGIRHEDLIVITDDGYENFYPDFF
jgi:Xaa-Pro aminopeptidase